MLQKRGKSLYRLARETGIPEGTLRKVRDGETDAITFRVLDALCEALECEPGELLVRTESKRNG